MAFWQLSQAGSIHSPWDTFHIGRGWAHEFAVHITRHPKAPGPQRPTHWVTVGVAVVNLCHGHSFHLLPPWYASKASGTPHLGPVAPMGPHLSPFTWAASTLSPLPQQVLH